MGRTSLHYAAGKHDGGHLYELLITAGADETVKDIVRKRLLVVVGQKLSLF